MFGLERNIMFGFVTTKLSVKGASKSEVIGNMYYV